MKRKWLLPTVALLAFAAIFAGCKSKDSSEDAYQDDMQELDESELANMELEGDDELQTVDDEELTDEEKELAQDLENSNSSDETEGTTEEELDQETAAELEESGQMGD